MRPLQVCPVEARGSRRCLREDVGIGRELSIEPRGGEPPSASVAPHNGPDRDSQWSFPVSASPQDCIAGI